MRGGGGLGPLGLPPPFGRTLALLLRFASCGLLVLYLGSTPTQGQDTGPADLLAEPPAVSRSPARPRGFDLVLTSHPEAHGVWHWPRPVSHVLREAPSGQERPRLTYASRLLRPARNYDMGAHYVLSENARRIDAVVGAGGDGFHSMINYDHSVGRDRTVGVALVTTEERDLSSVALAGDYRARRDNGLFYEFWAGITRASGSRSNGAAARLSFGKDSPQNSVRFTVDQYSSSYFPAGQSLSSHLPGTTGFALDVSHLQQFSSGPVNELYVVFAPFLRLTDRGAVQSRGHDLMISASSYDFDSGVDLYYSSAAYLTRSPATGNWSDDYDEDSFWEATATFCNSCQWRPSVNYTSGEFTGSHYRQWAMNLLYKAHEDVSLSFSAVWDEDGDDKRNRQELGVRWKPSAALQASARTSLADGQLDRVRLDLDAEVTDTFTISLSASARNRAAAVDADFQWSVGRGVFSVGLKRDALNGVELSAGLGWNF